MAHLKAFGKTRSHSHASSTNLTFSSQDDEFPEFSSKLIRAAESDKLSKVKNMIIQGGNINHRAQDGSTAIHYAASNANVSLVELLIDSEADINARRKNGDTALHIASANGFDDIITILISHGADFTIINDEGKFPIDVAVTDVTHNLLSNKEKAVEKLFGPFLTLLLSTPHTFLEALSDQVTLDDTFTRSQREAITKSIFQMFEWKQQALGLCKWVIYKEVRQTEFESTLFRSNSFSTRIMNSFAHIFGVQYIVKLLQDPIHRLIQNPGKLEIDPVKAGMADVTNNVQHLQLVVKTFLDSIIDQKGRMPYNFRVICGFLKQSVGMKFPNSRLTAVGGFIVLRYLNAAIMAPEKWPELLGPDVIVSPKARRGLILVAKIVQNLSNGIFFGEKEGYMTVMNDFVKDEMERFRSYLDFISTVSDSSGGDVEGIPIDKYSNSRALFILHGFTFYNFRRIAVQLGVDSKLVESKAEWLESSFDASIKPVSEISMEEALKRNREEAAPPGEVDGESIEMRNHEQFDSAKRESAVRINEISQRDVPHLKSEIMASKSTTELIAAAKLVRAMKEVFETPAQDLDKINLVKMRVSRPENREDRIAERDVSKVELLRNASLSLVPAFSDHLQYLLEQLNATSMFEVIAIIKARTILVKQLMMHYWGYTKMGMESWVAPDKRHGKMISVILECQDQLSAVQEELESTYAIEMVISIAQLLRNARTIISSPPGSSFQTEKLMIRRPKTFQIIQDGNTGVQKKLESAKDLASKLIEMIREILIGVQASIGNAIVTAKETTIVSRSKILKEIFEEFVAPTLELTTGGKIVDSAQRAKKKAEKEKIFNQYVIIMADLGLPRDIGIDF